MAEYVVDALGFWRSGYSATVEWTDVIGMDLAKRVSIQATAYSLGKRKMPDTIVVELSSKISGKSAGATVEGTTLAKPKRVQLRRLDKPPADAPTTGQKRTYYRLEIELADLGFMRPTSKKTVATVVRRGGTSDGYLRTALGFTSRGTAVQPLQAKERSGSQKNREPDAMAVLLAGGVELLDVRFVPNSGWKSAKESFDAERLIRSPATLAALMRLEANAFS